MPERLLYDTQKAAAERQRLLDLIPPPGPVFLAAAESARRRSGIRPLAERSADDGEKAADERRRLLELIPPPGPAFLAAAESALRRSGIRPLAERGADDGETGEAEPSGPDAA